VKPALNCRKAHCRTKIHNILILLKKRFAKSFYSKTALQAVLRLSQQKELKKIVRWCAAARLFQAGFT